MRGLFLGLTMCLGLIADAAAQIPATAPPYEIVKEAIDLEVAPSGQYWEERELTVRVLTSQGVEAMRQFSYSYTPGFQNMTVSRAFTTKKDGTRLDLPANRILYGAGQGSNNGYLADRTINGALPNVEIGDEVTIDTVFEQTVPWFPGVFAINFAMPRTIAVRDFRLALTAPAAGLNLALDIDGLEAGVTETGSGKVRKTWRFHSDAPVKGEADDTSEIDEVPHVNISTLSDYADAARLHAGLYADRAKPSPAIQALANQLTLGITDRRAQAKVLYDWVATVGNAERELVGQGLNGRRGFRPVRI